MSPDRRNDPNAPAAVSDSGDTRRPNCVLRRLGRLAVCCLRGFLILSVLLVMLYRQVQPPPTPLMLLRFAEGYGVRKN